MTTAVWQGVTIAESENVVLVERRVYFPLVSVRKDTLRPSEAPTSYCHWKGDATYYDIFLEGECNAAAAWMYQHPTDEARCIQNHVAFWHGVEVFDVPEGTPLTDPGGPLNARTGFRALCWLLERSEDEQLTPAMVYEKIGVAPENLQETFSHRCVVPFAKHLGWEWTDGAICRTPR